MLGDPQAASGGRRDIPLVPHLVWLTEWDHLRVKQIPQVTEQELMGHMIRKMHEVFADGQRRRLETDVVTGRLGA